MGANQSSRADGSNSAQERIQIRTQEKSVCYYEVLGVERQATDDEIKRAYRKKALELHPDRNYGNIEETTRLFAEVQSAYEVLSDSQERGWYDSHRDAILRDDNEVSGAHFEHNVRVTTAEDLLHMFTRFHGKIDFSDSSMGFYSVLRDTFDTIAKEEELACEWQSLNPSIYPSFGHADDNYEKIVRPFYAAWNGFATRKTFSWKDIYRFPDAPDRGVRRMMEKENRRFREEEIREFNDSVRSLVAFVKKRDPRFKPNTQSEAERQKILREAAMAQTARSRAANQAKSALGMTMPEWIDSHKLAEEEMSDEPEEEVTNEQIECVVCGKTFKSERQYEAHEKSKKHIKAVQRLRRTMQDEDTSLSLERNENGEPVSADVKDSSIELTGTHSNEVQNYDNAKILPEIQIVDPFDKNDSEAFSEEQIDNFKPTATNFETLPNSDLSSLTSDDEYASRDKVVNRIMREAVMEDISITSHQLQPGVDDLSKVGKKSLTGESDSTLWPKLGKAKEKRAKKAAQKAAVKANSDTDFKCAACQAGFPSNTRLFNHIKDLGHAQRLPKPVKGAKEKER